MAEYKINKRPKDDITIDEFVARTLNELKSYRFNEESFMEKALNQMGEEGTIKPKEFGWKVIYNENKKFYDENETGNDNDEKYNNNNENNKEKESLSQLINVKYNEMCKYGHGQDFYDSNEQCKCIICGLKKGIKWCSDCFHYAYSKGMDRDLSLFSYCFDCRNKNGIGIKQRIKMNDLKGKIIRKELLENRSLEMDILCNMKRAAALKTLIYDINKLEPSKRGQWCLFAMDIDHLKCWNDCLGHVKTDLLIKKIGSIMTRYINDINNGKWIDENRRYSSSHSGSLHSGFIYRTGGDEFVAVIQCRQILGASSECPLGSFYGLMKKEINGLGLNIKNLLNINENDWKKVKKKLKKAKNRKNKKIDMSCVGISCGLYVSSYNHNKEQDWLEKADKIALEHAKTVHLPKKNGISIYWEHIQALINDKKVEKCLKVGVYEGNQ